MFSTSPYSNSSGLSSRSNESRASISRPSLGYYAATASSVWSTKAYADPQSTSWHYQG